MGETFEEYAISEWKTHTHKLDARIAELEAGLAAEKEKVLGGITLEAQNCIRGAIIDCGVPDTYVDGGGCESSNPVDFTITEIDQGLGYFIDQRDEFEASNTRLREALERISRVPTDYEYMRIIAKQALEPRDD